MNGFMEYNEIYHESNHGNALQTKCVQCVHFPKMNLKIK